MSPTPLPGDSFLVTIPQKTVSELLMLSVRGRPCQSAPPTPSPVSIDKGPFSLLLHRPKRALQWWKRSQESTLLGSVINREFAGFPLGLWSEKGLVKTPAAPQTPGPFLVVHSISCSPPTGSLFSVSIEKALPEDRGLYKCVAKNSAGQAECSCQVTVDGKSCLSIVITHTRPISCPLPHLNEAPPDCPRPYFNIW